MNNYYNCVANYVEIRSETWDVVVPQAVTDKLYVSPAIETVSWANESGYPAYLYIHRTRVQGIL